MLLQGYVILDFCEDRKHTAFAFSEENEAKSAFIKNIEFYEPNLSDKELKAALKNGFYTNHNGSYVYLQKLNNVYNTRH